MAQMELPFDDPPLPHEVDDFSPSPSPGSDSRKGGDSNIASFLTTLGELRHLEERLLKAHELELRQGRDDSKPSLASWPSLPTKCCHKDTEVTTTDLSPRGRSGRRRPSLQVPDAEEPPMTHVVSGGSGPATPRSSVRQMLSMGDHSGGESRNLTAKLAQEAKKVSSNLEAQVHQTEQLSLEPHFDLRQDWLKDQEQLLLLKKKSLTAQQFNSGMPKGGGNFFVASDLPPRRFLHAGESTELARHRFILRPSSRPRFCWDIMAVIILMYDMISLPLAVFYYEAQAEYVLFLMQMLVTLYWLLDIPATFMTAVYVNNRLYTHPWDIARSYVTSWLFVDILILVPDIVVLLGSALSEAYSKNSLGMARAMRGGRILRLLRFLRLLRIVKLLKAADSLKARVNNASLLLAFSITKFVFITVYLMHVLACLWFYVGIEEGAWADMEGLQTTAASTQYTRALEWALARVHPSMMRANMELATAGEKVLAVIACFGALGFSTLFISSITNTMADVENKRQRQKQLLTSVREYCGSHYISATHAMKIKRYVEREHLRKKNLQAHLELLEKLPQDMLKELFHEARSQTLQNHELFDSLGRKNPSMEMDLCCKAISEHYMLASDKVFQLGEVATAMYIISTGRCVYTTAAGRSNSLEFGVKCSHSKVSGANSVVDFMNGAKQGLKFIQEWRMLQDGHQLGSGDCISEHTLWIEGWTRHGKMEAVSDGWLQAMSPKELFGVMQAYPNSLVDIVLYARFFVETLNLHFNEGMPISDLALDNLVDDENSAKQATAEHHGMGLISITPAEEALVS